MSHPDGRIAFFNDAAFDVAPTFQELTEYAERLAVVPRAQDEPRARPARAERLRARGCGSARA